MHVCISGGDLEDRVFQLWRSACVHNLGDQYSFNTHTHTIHELSLKIKEELHQRILTRPPFPPPHVQRVLSAAQLNMQRQEGLSSKAEAAEVRKSLAELNVNPDAWLPAGFKPLFLQVRVCICLCVYVRVRVWGWGWRWRWRSVGECRVWIQAPVS